MPLKKMRIDSNEKTCNNDSKQPTLPLDMVILILERLSFVDFHRARCVSSVWYSASKSCIGRIKYPDNPWLVLFQNKESNNGSCNLFDFRDQNTYTVRDLGFDFATSRCLASSGSWLLMLNSGINIYLLNLFTRERIRLPSLETYSRIPQRAILWVDEKSRDYLVVLNYDYDSLAYYRREDKTNSWKVFQPLLTKDSVYDLVFRESKLYVLRSSSIEITPNIIVFDFSSHGDNNDSPKECASFPAPDFYHREQYYMNLAVTLSGEILIIGSDVEPCPGICFFDIYKMDPKSSKWSIIKSIGDEVLLLDLGITVAAKDDVMLMRNCIYFGNDQANRISGKCLSNDNNCICVYDIQTDKVLQWFRRLPEPFKDARWFLPTF